MARPRASGGLQVMAGAGAKRLGLRSAPPSQRRRGQAGPPALSRRGAGPAGGPAPAQGRGAEASRLGLRSAPPSHGRKGQAWRPALPRWRVGPSEGPAPAVSSVQEAQRREQQRHAPRGPGPGGRRPRRPSAGAGRRGAPGRPGAGAEGAAGPGTQGPGQSPALQAGGQGSGSAARATRPSPRSELRRGPPTSPRNGPSPRTAGTEGRTSRAALPPSTAPPCRRAGPAPPAPPSRRPRQSW